MKVLINLFARRLFGINKSLKRDVQILLKINENQNFILNVMRDFNCNFSQSKNGLCNNKYAFDLCAFYMAQIGEKIKLLTDSTKSEISKTIKIETFVYFRNIIDHDYDR